MCIPVWLEMVSESVSHALAKSDKRAVRIAEADAGLGDKSEESNFTEQKQCEALANAKEKWRPAISWLLGC